MTLWLSVGRTQQWQFGKAGCHWHRSKGERQCSTRRRWMSRGDSSTGGEYDSFANVVGDFVEELKYVPVRTKYDTWC